MAKQQKSEKKIDKQINPIVSIDVYEKRYFQFTNNTLQPLRKLSYNKKSLVLSTLNESDYITTLIEISTNIPAEDLEDAIALKAYDELGLDQSIDYMVQMVEIEHKRNEKNRYFQLFVADPETVVERFNPIRSATRFIDFIYPKAYLLTNLYRHNILDNYGTHGFLYFQKEDAFLAIYMEGEYFFSKSIAYSFNYMHERLCEIYGERIDEAFFDKILQEEGLKTLDLEMQDHLMTLFNEVFMHVKEVLSYALRSQDRKLDTFFIGSSVGPIMGINEYASAYLGKEAEDFDFEYQINRSEWYIDQFHYLSILEAMEYQKGLESPNFTLFFRPPPFVKRRSGRFLIATAAVTLLGLSLPTYHLVYDYLTKLNNMRLAKKQERLGAIVMQLRREIAQKEATKTALSNKVSIHKKRLHKKEKILETIYDKKVNYPMKASYLVLLGNEMARFGIRMETLVNNQNLFTLSLYADDEKKITQYIKYLTNHYATKLHTTMEEIYKDKEGIYHCDLKVQIL